MDRKSAPRTRTRAANEFSSFTKAIGMETTIKIEHERGVPPVNPLQQVVQTQGHEDKTDHANEFARDAEAKERLGGRNVAGWRKAEGYQDVSTHDENGRFRNRCNQVGAGFCSHDGQLLPNFVREGLPTIHPGPATCDLPLVSGCAQPLVWKARHTL